MIDQKIIDEANEIKKALNPTIESVINNDHTSIGIILALADSTAAIAAEAVIGHAKSFDTSEKVEAAVSSIEDMFRQCFKEKLIAYLNEVL